ncbi:MAG: hypothetical protein ACLSAF_07525 [Intestinimonas sp.]
MGGFVENPVENRERGGGDRAGPHGISGRAAGGPGLLRPAGAAALAEAERPARAERGGEPQWKIDYCLERCPCRGRSAGAEDSARRERSGRHRVNRGTTGGAM